MERLWCHIIDRSAQSGNALIKQLSYYNEKNSIIRL